MLRRIGPLIICLFYFLFSLWPETAAANNLVDGVPVLVFHQIATDGSKEPSETVISLEKFSQQMEYLHNHGYHTLSIEEFIWFMKGGEAPEKPVMIHFDDGWKSVKYALPVLKKYGFKASFSIIAQKGIGNDYLEWEDIIALDQDPDFKVFSHTMTHPWDPADNLITWVQGKNPGKGIEEAEWELRESKKVLEQKLHKEVPYLAWPCGWYNETLIQIAEKVGYRALFTMVNGPNKPGDDLLRLRRVLVNGACDLKEFQEILQNPAYQKCHSENGGRVQDGSVPDQQQPSGMK